jgi:uncharacterized protein (DUF427 family)
VVIFPTTLENKGVSSMKYLYKSIKAPSRLYIKQCSHCNLKYFGKTSSKDIENYKGSGKYWKNHIRKHKSTVMHLWNSNWYYDTSIIRFAIKFSRINKIVASSQWANLIEENGIDGANFGNTIDESAIEKRKNTVNSKEWKETIGKESIRKSLKTRSSKEWKETVGKQGYLKVSEKTKGKPRPWAEETFREQKEKIRNGEAINPSTKVWEITLPSGEVIIVENLAYFCKENGLSQGNLSRYGKTKGYYATCLGYLKDFRNH